MIEEDSLIELENWFRWKLTVVFTAIKDGGPRPPRPPRFLFLRPLP